MARPVTLVAGGQIAGQTHGDEINLKGLLGGGLPEALSGAGALKVDVGNTITVTGGLTDAQLRATAVPVSGTFWQTTQPVSGPLTDTQLRASHVHVDAQLIDEAGTAYGVKHINNKPRVSSMPYLYDIAEGNVTGHAAWTKIGFNPDIGTAEEDIWTVGGTYAWPAAGIQMQIVSASAKDVGARAITAFADAGSGNTTVTCGTHGLANSDIVTISGTTNYNGTYTIANVATNTFTIVKAFVANDATGALAGPGVRTVKVHYLDNAYAEQSETVTLNGVNTVNTVATDIFRIQSFRVTSAGATAQAVGNITIKNTGATVTYGMIAAGYTRARNITYTVPAGYVLYVTSIAYGVYGATKGVRITNRATYDPAEDTVTDFFMPFTEIVMGNGTFYRELEIPTKLPAYTRLKVSAVADAIGAVVSCALRGWLETEADEAPAMMALAAPTMPIVHNAPMGKPTLWERLRGRG